MRHRLEFAGKKCIRMMLLLLGVSLAAFLLMAASPLDPLQTNVGQVALGSMSPEQVAQMEDYWGTNTPCRSGIWAGWPTRSGGTSAPRCCTAGRCLKSSRSGWGTPWGCCSSPGGCPACWA